MTITIHKFSKFMSISLKVHDEFLWVIIWMINEATHTNTQHDNVITCKAHTHAQDYMGSNDYYAFLVFWDHKLSPLKRNNKPLNSLGTIWKDNFGCLKQQIISTQKAAALKHTINRGVDPRLKCQGYTWLSTCCFWVSSWHIFSYWYDCQEARVGDGRDWYPEEADDNDEVAEFVDPDEEDVFNTGITWGISNTGCMAQLSDPGFSWVDPTKKEASRMLLLLRRSGLSR